MLRRVLLAGLTLAAAPACSSSATAIDHSNGASEPVIAVSRDDQFSGALTVLGGPEIVVYGDGSVVVRKFTSDNLPHRARFDEATIQRLLRAAKTAGLVGPAPVDENGIAGAGSAAAPTRLLVITATG